MSARTSASQIGGGRPDPLQEELSDRRPPLPRLVVRLSVGSPVWVARIEAVPFLFGSLLTTTEEPCPRGAGGRGDLVVGGGARGGHRRHPGDRVLDELAQKSTLA